ncbi:13433_t:CDS:2 [Entrophospora sp. SA101]|nr:13433_t:CDS:2 [Entrophospora sp. SA101]
MVKENKHTYTLEFIALVTQMSNIGQSSLSSTVQCTREFFTFLVGDSPDTWISTSTLSKWNQDVARITVSENLPGTTSQFSSYGIMADESTRGSRNVPEGYLHKWKTFLGFLENEKLNIEILIMVKFGKWFYEKLMYFLISSDTNSSHPLPNGYRAHQMPDMVQTWIIIVKKYIGRLNKNLEDQSNSLGLFEALEKNNFREQFVAFSKANYIQLKEFPLIYDFVRHCIWSIIVHQ